MLSVDRAGFGAVPDLDWLNRQWRFKHFKLIKFLINSQVNTNC